MEGLNPNTRDVTLLAERMVVDVVKLKCHHWGRSKFSATGVLVKEGMHCANRGRTAMWRQAETGVSLPHAQKHLRLPEAGRGEEGVRANMALPTL